MDYKTSKVPITPDISPSKEGASSLTMLDQQSRDEDVEKNAAQSPPSTSQLSNGEDPDIVDWDGPNDPELPINWPQLRKWRNVLLVATLTFLT